MGRPLADTLLLNPRNIIPAPGRYRQRSSMPDTGGRLTARRKVVIEAGLGHVSVWGRCRISQSIIVLLGINSTALQNISQNLIRKNIFCTAPCPKFGNDFCAHGIIPNCSLFNFIHMRYDDTINVENNIGIKEFISNHWKDENKCSKNSTTKYGSKINNFTKVFLFPPECTTACAVYRAYRLYRLYNQLLVSSAPKLWQQLESSLGEARWYRKYFARFQKIFVTHGGGSVVQCTQWQFRWSINICEH